MIVRPSGSSPKLPVDQRALESSFAVRESQKKTLNYNTLEGGTHSHNRKIAAFTASVVAQLKEESLSYDKIASQPDIAGRLSKEIKNSAIVLKVGDLAVKIVVVRDIYRYQSELKELSFQTQLKHPHISSVQYYKRKLSGDSTKVSSNQLMNKGPVLLFKVSPYVFGSSIRELVEKGDFCRSYLSCADALRSKRMFAKGEFPSLPQNFITTYKYYLSATRQLLGITQDLHKRKIVLRGLEPDNCLLVHSSDKDLHPEGVKVQLVNLKGATYLGLRPPVPVFQDLPGEDFHPKGACPVQEMEEADLLPVEQALPKNEHFDDLESELSDDSVYNRSGYIDPKVLHSDLDEPFDEDSDLWSVGVILFQLMTGKAPFDTKDRVIYANETEHFLKQDDGALREKVLKQLNVFPPMLKEVFKALVFREGEKKSIDDIRIIIDAAMYEVNQLPYANAAN